jgi:hypothetical protein
MDKKRVKANILGYFWQKNLDMLHMDYSIKYPLKNLQKWLVSTQLCGKYQPFVFFGCTYCNFALTQHVWKADINKLEFRNYFDEINDSEK